MVQSPAKQFPSFGWKACSSGTKRKRKVCEPVVSALVQIQDMAVKQLILIRIPGDYKWLNYTLWILMNISEKICININCFFPEISKKWLFDKCFCLCSYIWDTVYSILYCVVLCRNTYRILSIRICICNTQYIYAHCAVTYRIIQYCTILHRITSYYIMSSPIVAYCKALYQIVTYCIVSYHHILPGGAVYVFISFLWVLLFSITFDIKMCDILMHHVPPSRTVSPNSKNVAISQRKKRWRKPTARSSNVDGRERGAKRGHLSPRPDIHSSSCHGRATQRAPEDSNEKSAGLVAADMRGKLLGPCRLPVTAAVTAPCGSPATL